MVETGLVELLDQLGIARAHFAGRGSADLKGFASNHPERIASLTLLCPAVLDTRALKPLAERMLIVTGDHGPGPQRVRAALSELPQATAVVLNDYAGHTWRTSVRSAVIALARRCRSSSSVATRRPPPD